MKQLIFIISFLSLAAHAAVPSQDWIMFCGDQKTFSEHAEREFGGKPSAKELKELNESRKPILKVLAGGNKAIKELLDEGSRSDTGPFGVIMACGMLVNLKHEIAEKGCFSLTSTAPIKDKGGIKACEDLLAKMPK